MLSSIKNCLIFENENAKEKYVSFNELLYKGEYFDYLIKNAKNCIVAEKDHNFYKNEITINNISFMSQTGGGWI